MGVDAFALRIEDVDLIGEEFLGLFLVSSDFDTQSLRAISGDLGLPVSRNKAELATEIALRTASSRTALANVLEHLIVTRRKGWASVKLGSVGETPARDDPGRLLVGLGEEQWYGPINTSHDVNATWYIRSVLVPHWSVEESNGEATVQEFRIRWLCFARIEGNALSLHWRGFSSAETRTDAGSRNAQFPYWQHVPELFREIESFTGASVNYPPLHRVLLHDMWDEFRHNTDYEWADRRIRAEASGVTFSARAGAIYQIEAGGIRQLAHTIRRAIEEELRRSYKTSLPDGAWFDEVILRTLIREYGTLSYEFSLEKENEVLFRAHTYFGQRSDRDSPDRFPHMNLHITKRDDLEQIAFLLEYVSRNENRQPTQASLL